MSGNEGNLRAIQPGEARNPTGRNQYTYRREFERSIDRLLAGEFPDGERERVGIPPEVLKLLPEGATRGEVIAHVAVLRAVQGDEKVQPDVLARLWPKLNRHQLTGLDDAPVEQRLNHDVSPELRA